MLPANLLSMLFALRAIAPVPDPPAKPPPPVSILVTRLEAHGDATQELADAVSRALAAELAKLGPWRTTAQLDPAPGMNGDAAGPDELISGSVGIVAGRHYVALSRQRADGGALGHVMRKVATEEELFAVLGAAAAELMGVPEPARPPAIPTRVAPVAVEKEREGGPLAHPLRWVLVPAGLVALLLAIPAMVGAAVGLAVWAVVGILDIRGGGVPGSHAVSQSMGEAALVGQVAGFGMLFVAVVDLAVAAGVILGAFVVG